MNWTAIVPIKPAGERKRRLAPMLSPAQRLALSEVLLAHVLETLRASAQVSRVLLLAGDRPKERGEDWIEDRGRGLNAELGFARQLLPEEPLLVVHADLPFLQASDIAAMTRAAVPGIAIAADRHGKGTNAVALQPDRPFRFAFGEESLLAHCRQTVSAAAVVDTAGLALDLDTPEDVARAVARGFALPAA